MLKYLLRRILHGLVSIVLVVAIIMIIVYGLLSRDFIFQNDATYTKTSANAKEVYKNRRWADYGYIVYVNYNDYLSELVLKGEISQDKQSEVSELSMTDDVVKRDFTVESDTEEVKTFVRKFVSEYRSKGFEIVRLRTRLNSRGEVQSGGNPYLYAVKDRNVFVRIWEFFTGLLTFDNIHYAQGKVENRGLTFTFFDPAYGGKTFAPAIMGNGTKHKYLLYFDGRFPYIHQNLITISLGTSYSISRGEDIFKTMTQSQGILKYQETTFPTGYKEVDAIDIHTLTYSAGSNVSEYTAMRFTDDYTQVENTKVATSRIGFSFIIGIISVVLAYLIAVPAGIYMARKKDKLMDKLGTFYIVFISAVPSLAYILMFKSIGQNMGLPGTFDVNESSFPYFVLPIVSSTLPAIAGLMKWLRRYMIDQMNSDYVKFARSGALSEGEIFTKHIFKNAAIPLVHGIPGTILFCMVGGIITESVYVVPGTGKLLTNAINFYDNSVIVGVAFFYAIMSVTSLILGDILMSMMDPRISFSTKGR